MKKDTLSRNLSEYSANYLTLPFEPIQLEFRRKLVLREILRHNPRRLLEIGCGMSPLFTSLPDDIVVTVVEPIEEFARNASQLAKNYSNVKVIHGFMENCVPSGERFDFIVLSCLLHEVTDPDAMLAAVRQSCCRESVLHVNVPNANSLHRLLAVAMGLMPDRSVQSDTQRIMQQRSNTYDLSSLRVQLEAAGFAILDQGSFFVKPFTHSQMQLLVDQGFMDTMMLNGFDKLVNFLPDLGSEIWVNAKLN